MAKGRISASKTSKDSVVVENPQEEKKDENEIQLA